MGLLGAALQKEGPKSGAVGVKGLRTPGGTSQAHSGSQAEAAEQVFGHGRTPGPTREKQGHTVGSHLLGLRGCICQSGVL